MSISAVNDSKVDLLSTLEVQNDQTIFKAAFPYILHYSIHTAIVGLVAKGASLANQVALATYSESI